MKKHMIDHANGHFEYYLCKHSSDRIDAQLWDGNNWAREVCKNCLAIFNQNLHVKLEVKS